MKQYRITKPVALIELFGGIGTQALAFETLGVPFVRHRLVEFDDEVVEAYNRIHGTHFIPMDIRDVHIEDLGISDKKHLHYFLTYSFPCTSISTAGKMAGYSRESWEAGEGAASGLLWEVFRILKEGYEKGASEGDTTKYLPDTLLMENVVQVHAGKNKKDWEAWLSFLASCGYKTVWQDMNAVDYGVPQKRNRCFAVSFLDTEAEFSFPEPIPLSSSIEDHLEDEVESDLYIEVDKGGGRWAYGKYRSFYEKHGYIPRIFHPYNEADLRGVCSTITTNTGTTTGIGTVLVSSVGGKDHLVSTKKEKRKKLTVLSLFDGISCGQLALERAGVEVGAYYASEIEKAPIEVAMSNFPETIEIGDVRNVDVSKLPPIDLLIGGSPCTNLSFAGNMVGCMTKSREKVTTLERYMELKDGGFQFEGFSYLFWEYVRILRDIQAYNPGVLFFLENVVMAKEWEDVFTETLGVGPIKLNSSLVSAQNRVRLYWTNIPYPGEPLDKNILLKDILEKTEWDDSHPGAIRGRYKSDLSYQGDELRKASITGRRIDENGHRQDYNHDIKIVQCLEVRDESAQKSNCLVTAVKDNVLTPLPPGRHLDAFGMISGVRLPFRYYTRREYERLQTLPDGYTDCVSEHAAKKAIGNGWTVDMIAHLFQGIHDA